MKLIVAFNSTSKREIYDAIIRLLTLLIATLPLVDKLWSMF